MNRRGHEVIVGEVRTRTGYDSCLCCPGLLVYRVDMTPLRRSPVQLYSVEPRPRTRVGRCSNAWNASFRPGQTFSFPNWRLRIAVLARLADGSHRLRVTRR